MDDTNEIASVCIGNIKALYISYTSRRISQPGMALESTRSPRRHRGLATVLQ